MATATPFAPHVSAHHTPQAVRTRPIVPMQPIVRRRGSIEQGRALETLGHALEYLEDSRMYMADSGDESAELEAIGILRNASRTVFSECPVIQPLRSRLSRWMTETVFGV